MARDNVVLQAFNRGIISELGLARTDLKRTALSAIIMINWMTRVLGSTALRPGLQYVDGILNNSVVHHVPFVYSRSDKAIIEFTDQIMRVRVNEVPISRVAVSTTVTSGDFSSATGWTDSDESGATSTISGGTLQLKGTGFNSAIRDQTVAVAVGDQNKEHALRIEIDRGPVTLRVGSSSGADDYISETTLGEGTHSLAFTPTGDFYIRFQNTRSFTTIVDSCQIEAAGEMQIASPYLEDDMKLLRADQSADVVYLACYGYAQYKIERRATRSWSLVKYLPEDGPFRNINTTNITIASSATSGDVTLTASKKLFKSTQVGSLIKLESSGQRVDISASGDGQWSDSIRVSGAGTARVFSVVMGGTWSGRVTIQRSFGEEGNWTDWVSYTSITKTNLDDGFDNQIIYYRIGIDTGDYTSGTAILRLTWAGGSITGYARITGFTSDTQVSAVVLKNLGGITGTADWYEGSWSDRRGYPSAVKLHEGRLWWAGRGNIYGSVSDGYESFDSEVEGDSAPINRSIGFGPVDEIKWLLSLQRLIVGTDTREVVARSSSFDEPLTVTNFNLKAPSTQGSGDVEAIKIDQTGIFVNGIGDKLFRLEFSDTSTLVDYNGVDLMELCPEVGRPSITRLAVQRQPDTRVHCVRSDGIAAVLVSQPAEEVLCWLLVETDGIIEDVFVMPGDTGGTEDEVYYTVRRTVDGNTVRYLEKWAVEADCVGGTLNKQADSFIVYEGTATDTITGLDHLEGEEVIVWADGKDYSTGTGDDQVTYTVTGGEITLPDEVSAAVVGLPYKADFQSTKLAYANNLSTALGQRKRVDHLGLILKDTHINGLQYGKDFDNLDNLPRVINDIPYTEDTVFSSVDSGMFEFPGDWDTDSRICLRAHAPRPCTLLAAVIGMKTNDKT